MIVREFVKDSWFQIYPKPGKPSRQRRELSRRVVREVKFARLEVAAYAVVMIHPRCRKDGLVESAEALLGEAIGIPIRIEVHAIATVQ